MNVKHECGPALCLLLAELQVRYSAMEALGYFQSRVQQIVKKHGKSAMFWDEFWVRTILLVQIHGHTTH